MLLISASIETQKWQKIPGSSKIMLTYLQLKFPFSMFGIASNCSSVQECTISLEVAFINR